MVYISAAVIAAPTAGREPYAAFAREMAPMIRGLGALRVVDAWGDQVPPGKRTDMYRAVDSTPEETPVFSWIEFPDAETAAACMEAMSAPPAEDAPPFEMPFDGQRMIFGGFELLSERGAGAPGAPEAYIDAALFPVATSARERYGAEAVRKSEAIIAAGALRCLDGWGDHVPEGKRTDMRRAVALEDGESVALGFIEWPSKAVRDAAWEKLMADPEFSGEMVGDMSRAIFGGFAPLVDA
ncbi:DUF1428 domain-containing protein [Albimonas pacifica]|uniref:Uncharacterized conserved protein YbaA, DUF1428 family n=1 Tax=Albimonas pacifica TaxID=1114924 RepID=A0A1I3F2R2_9RHOB|nr:DUF1428 domain-containing protein [Albimonas pacifica]SFI05478.1 Uncharacterized conserved protein YbaA, DUF1428 family [Albimonas pacifica]